MIKASITNAGEKTKRGCIPQRSILYKNNNGLMTQLLDEKNIKNCINLPESR